MAVRTISLKLYKPGKRKCRIIDDAMQRYSQAFQYLLEKSAGQLDEIREGYTDKRGRCRALGIAGWVGKNLGNELNRFGVEPFKDSLKLDFGMTLAGFMNSSGQKPNKAFPRTFSSEEQWEKTYSGILDALCSEEKPPAQCERAFAALMRRCASPRPIFFCRYAANRDYSLLYDRNSGRYYVKLYVMNVRSADRMIIKAAPGRELRYVGMDNKLLERSGRRERYLIVPLAFGRWQEQYLRIAGERPGMLRTARLVKKNNEYFLKVSIETDEAEKIETAFFLGVARGIKNAINYTVADNNGSVVCQGKFHLASVKNCSDGVIPDNEIHKIANLITDIAAREKAQVIVESLAGRNDRLEWPEKNGTGCKPAIGFSSYIKLVNILQYKLSAKGLPMPVKVSPVGIFHACPSCGSVSRKNRFSRDLFICTDCGMSMNIEQLGSFNLAHRLLQYGRTPVKITAERTPDGTLLVNRDLGLKYLLPDQSSCLDDFKDEIRRIIDDFHSKINEYPKDSNFKKKLSIIKKIEKADDILRVIQIL